MLVLFEIVIVSISSFEPRNPEKPFAGGVSPAPARRNFSGEARKPEAGRKCPSLSSQAVNASAASCTGNEKPMLHEASSIDSSRLLHLNTLQRAEKRKKRRPRSLSPSRPGRHNVLLTFASNRHRRHFRSLPFEFDLFIPSVSHSPSCSQLGPRNQEADEHPQEATLGRCGVLPHFVQLFRPCVRRARTLDQVDHPRKPHQPLGHPLPFNRADLPFFFLFRHFFQLRRDCHGATRLGVAIDQTHGARLPAS